MGGVSIFSVIEGDGRKRESRADKTKSQKLSVPVMLYRNGTVQPGDDQPDHLLVLVHGILSKPGDWSYAKKKLQNQLGGKFLIHAYSDLRLPSMDLHKKLIHGDKKSISMDLITVPKDLFTALRNTSAVNSLLSTLGGIEPAGRRLASEIEQIVEKVPSLKRISFIAHSLGGLFSRYAVAMLYTPRDDLSILEDLEGRGEEHPAFRLRQEPKIAGLEAVSFITLASPHLGVRGKQQVVDLINPFHQLPFLLGLPVLEKIAAPIAPFVVGRTGKQLFLTDGKASDPPLLLRMASDCREGLFISALRAFKSRVVYANVSYDHLVGWRTSSIRRERELSKPPRVSMKDKDGNVYTHVVNDTFSPAVNSDAPTFQQESAEGKAAAQVSPSSKKANEYHDKLEEEIVQGLQQVSWRKVDVSFHSALWPFLAHNSMTVKDKWIHHEGKGVIAHVVDIFKQQDQHQNLQLWSSL